MRFKTKLIAALAVFIGLLLVWGVWSLTRAQSFETERIAERTTAWTLIGPNHRIVTDAFPVQHVKGIYCWIGRPKTGGITGAIGLAEDLSNSDIDCDQIGPIVIEKGFKNGQKIFAEDRNILFKDLETRVTYDSPRRAFVFLTTTGHIINGSPQFGQEVVTAKPWGAAEPDVSAIPAE